MSAISERLRELINEKEVTAYEVSKMTGISQATLSRILNQATTKLSIKSTRLLSEYFGVKYDWLSTGKGEKEAPKKEFAATTYPTGRLAADNYLQSDAQRMLCTLENLTESNRILALANQEMAANNSRLSAEVLDLLRRER